MLFYVRAAWWMDLVTSSAKSFWFQNHIFSSSHRRWLLAKWLFTSIFYFPTKDCCNQLINHRLSEELLFEYRTIYAEQCQWKTGTITILYLLFWRWILFIVGILNQMQLWNNDDKIGKIPISIFGRFSIDNQRFTGSIIHVDGMTFDLCAISSNQIPVTQLLV